MARITGIGGVFLRTKSDPKELLKWYHEVLGLDVSDIAINFLSPNELTLITFDNKAEEAVLNFTVDNLGEFLEGLKEKGVAIHHDIKDYDYGRFAQIKDPFDNIIELWETKKEAYIKMVENEIAEYRRQFE